MFIDSTPGSTSPRDGDGEWFAFAGDFFLAIFLREGLFVFVVGDFRAEDPLMLADYRVSVN